MDWKNAFGDAIGDANAISINDLSQSKHCDYENKLIC